MWKKRNLKFLHVQIELLPQLHGLTSLLAVVIGPLGLAALLEDAMSSDRLRVCCTQHNPCTSSSEVRWVYFCRRLPKLSGLPSPG